MIPSLLLLGLALGVCPDLTGHYRLEAQDGHVEVVIRQEACARIHITWNIYSHPDTARSAHTLRLDGAFQTDTAWFGATGHQMTAARFLADTLEITARALGASDSSFLWRHFIVRRGERAISSRLEHPAGSSQQPRPPRDTVGCYYATPRLTYSAFGQPEGSDTAWAILRLQRDGTARRPLLRPSLDGRSRWGYRADTLIVFLSDGLVGWMLTLQPSGNGWRGNARYLTDVMGPPPINRALQLERRSCEGLPD